MDACTRCLKATRDEDIVYYICRNPDNKHYNHRISPAEHNICLDKADTTAEIEDAEESRLLAQAYTPGVPRPDLAAIGLTLPPKDGVERSFQRPIFEPDGAIRYPKNEGDWECPRVPTGYVRSKDDPWLLLPLWLPCSLRNQMAYLNVNCGCVLIVMRCNDPETKVFGKRLDAEACQACKYRRAL